MSLIGYVRQVRPIQESHVNHLDKVCNSFLYEKMMHPDELVKYGGRKAKALQKAIEKIETLEAKVAALESA